MKLKPLVASMMLAGLVVPNASFAGDAVFYITEEGEAVSDIAVTVNGKKQLVRKNGFTVFDVPAGEHEVELSQYGEWVGDFTFTTETDSQNAEISVEMIAGEAMADVQVYEPDSEQAQASGQDTRLLVR